MQSSGTIVARLSSRIRARGVFSSRPGILRIGALVLAPVVIVSIVAVGILVAVPAPVASAAETPSPSEAPSDSQSPSPSDSQSISPPSPSSPSPSSPRPSPPPPSVEALRSTTITTDPVAFSPTGRVVVSGTKLAGSSVSVNAAGSALCTVRADAAATWSCGEVSLPDGAAIELTAIEVAADGSSVRPGSTTVDVLGPPDVDAGAPVTTGLVSGVGHPGSVVAVSVDGTVDAACAAVPVQFTSFWSCNLARGSGGPVSITATQSNAGIGDDVTSASSPARSLTIDRDAPASASIVSPAAGTRVQRVPVVVTGTGEESAAVDLYVDDSPVCSTLVVGGTWSCTVTSIADGAHTLQAIQRDAAGNYAAPSAVSTVFFGPRPAAQQAAPEPSESPAPSPSEPAPAPSTTPDAASPAPGPPLSASGGDAGGGFGGWGLPSGFGADLETAAGITDSGHWYTAPLLALLFVVLVAMPLRLLAGAFGGRVRMPHPSVTGRNRDRRDILALRGTLADRSVLRPWIVSALALVACAVLAVFAGGVEGEVRYVRLFLAVTAGLAILSIVGSVVATRSAATSLGVVRRLTFLPVMLLAAALTAIASRLTDLDPPFVAGVLIGAGFASGVPVRARALVNLAQVGTLTTLGAVGWMLHGALGDATGFWPSVVSETLATLCLAGLGSALIMMIPIASLPGRAILQWSVPAWTGSMFVVASVTAMAVLGSADPAVLMPLVAAATVFACLSVATWAFLRFVEPHSPAAHLADSSGALPSPSRARDRV